MELSNMNMEDVLARLAELDTEVREAQDVESVEKATEEKKALLERKAELEDLETRKADALALQNEKVEADKVIEERKEEKTMEENKVITTESKEYRDAFYAWIGGKETAEQRTVLGTPVSVDGDGSDDGAAIAIPKTLDTKIWDNIHTAHPILADINTVASGVVMEVTRHTAITNRASKKNDGATNNSGDQTNTFVKVTLAGADYETYAELTYAEAKMSKGALEDYLATEIADELGEALAKDVFARILSDATNAQKVTASDDMFADVKAALALATQANNPVVYAPAASYYNLVGAQNANGTPVNIKGVFGCEIKRDDAATKITVVDPAMFILNEVQSVTIEKDKDIKAHRVIVSGYVRAEGTLRKTAAASWIN